MAYIVSSLKVNLQAEFLVPYRTQSVLLHRGGLDESCWNAIHRRLYPHGSALVRLAVGRFWLGGWWRHDAQHAVWITKSWSTNVIIATDHWILVHKCIGPINDDWNDMHHSQCLSSTTVTVSRVRQRVSYITFNDKIFNLNDKCPFINFAI